MADIKKLMDFVAFTNKFREVERVVFSKDNPRQESDSEHAFQLAAVAWYIISTEKLSLNLEKAVLYALAHDLVEVYAGDTYIYTKDQSLLNSKKEREEKALERIKSDLDEFPELHEMIESYEKKADAESRFIYALDKILPAMNIFLEGGKLWREEGSTLDMLILHKDPKIALAPDLVPYWNEFRALLERNKDDLFPKAIA